MESIDGLRKSIDETDDQIIALLAHRQELARKIGLLKIKENKAVDNPLREQQLFSHYQELSQKYNLHQTFIKRLFKMIIAYSRMVQKYECH